MKTAFLLLVIALGSAALHAQPPAFGKYISSIKDGRESQELVAFSKECGLHQRAQRKFAFAKGNWELTADLPKLVYDSKSDSSDTAEVWFVDNKPALVATWTTDAYLAQERISCLNDDKVFSQQVTSWSCEGERCEQVVIRRGLDKTGTLVQLNAEFISSAGVQQRLTPQVMDKQSYEFSTSYPDNRFLKDFKFPTKLLELQRADHATP
jgi:hypothetical protein